MALKGYRNNRILQLFLLFKNLHWIRKKTHITFDIWQNIYHLWSILVATFSRSMEPGIHRYAKMDKCASWAAFAAKRRGKTGKESKKYQPSGEGDTHSTRAMPHHLQHFTACLLLNPKWSTGSGNKSNPMFLDPTNNFHFISFFIWSLFNENLKNLKGPPGGPKMADVVWRGVSPQVFVGSCQLMSNKFFDPRSRSIRKVCYREKCGGRKEWGK